MIKKQILLLVTLLSLTACSTSTVKNTSFIEPISNDETIFMAFNKTARNAYEEIEEKDIVNIEKPFLNLGEVNLPNIDLTTYDGKTINLLNYKGQNIVVELVLYDCGYCQSMASTFNTIAKNNTDITFIQAFIDGAKEDKIEYDDGDIEIVDTIAKFYSEANEDLDNNVIITEENDDFFNFVAQDVDVVYYPSVLFFDKNGKLAYYHENTMKEDVFQSAIDKIYKDNFCFYDNFANGLKTAKNYIRTWEDVKKDFSKEQQTTISSIFTDKNVGEESFYSNVGKIISLNDIFDDSNENKIKKEDISSNAVITFLNKNKLDEDVSKIDEFQKQLDDDVTFITLYYEGFKNSSHIDVYKNSYARPENSYTFKAKKDVSMDLNKLTFFDNYSEVIFLNNEVCAGAYAGELDVDTLVQLYKVSQTLNN